MATAAVPALGTIQEAADRKHVSEKTIRRWIAQGRIKAERVGPRLIRVDLASLDDLATAIEPTSAVTNV